MSLFLETIKINNGRRINLDGHNQRMNWTRNRHFHEIRDLNLQEYIDVPLEFKEGIVKCRVIYGRKIESVSFEKYEFKNPQSFQIVDGDKVDYAYKYANRTILSDLYHSRGSADDILIVKEGRITDSYYANVALKKDKNWYTPKNPLLNGTQRQKLISRGKLIEKDIFIEALFEYDAIKIFNALTEWRMHEPITISKMSIAGT